MLNRATVAVAAVIIFGTAFAVQAGSKDDGDHSGGFRVGPLGQLMGGPPPGAPPAFAYYGGNIPRGAYATYGYGGYAAYGYGGYGAFASALGEGCSSSSANGIVCDGRCWVNISNGNYGWADCRRR